MEEKEDYYFAITTPGLEELAAEEIKEVLERLGKESKIGIQSYVESNFLSGQIYFSCSSLISPRKIVANVQSVERICASIAQFTPIPKKKEDALDFCKQASYYWDENQFQRACSLWKECRDILVNTKTTETNGKEMDLEKEFDCLPRYTNCINDICYKDPSVCSPFRINEPICYTISHLDEKKKEEIKEQKDNECTIQPPPLPPKDYSMKGEKPKSNSKTVIPQKSEFTSHTIVDYERKPNTAPTFRVTCQRDGMKHEFNSVEIASSLGGSVFLKYDWKVSLEYFDIHIWAQLYQRTMLVGITLTPEPSILHQKSRVLFGHTSLKPRYYILFQVYYIF